MMKTEVRKEHGDWIVFVDDNPQFSFMYQEEAERVRNMVDVLVLAHKALMFTETDPKKAMDNYRLIREIEKALKDIGAI